jgi:2-polyprenyl-6-methoxyphenol hydroxylase-like FAD-dependent oxidoreductase
MNDQHASATAGTGGRDGVIVAGAGPVGCTMALLLADLGVPVTLLERHTQPHPLPRAVHLDDEVMRTLCRAGTQAAPPRPPWSVPAAPVPPPSRAISSPPNVTTPVT